MAPAPMTIATALRSPGIDLVDARVLLQHVLSVKHAYLIAHSERTLTQAEAARVQACFERRVGGEPVAYIVGRREFFGRDFLLSPAVLIPRPETELLVETALEKMSDIAAPRVLDLGTGSGCIAITLGLERPDAPILATDINAEALRLAAANAAALNAKNVSFVASRWFDALGAAAFELIVSNPPYIAEADTHLSEGDLRFEPRSALASGPTGLDDIAVIAARAPRYLSPGGWLLLEHGFDQAEAVCGILASAGFEDRFMTRDLAGHPRISGGRIGK